MSSRSPSSSWRGWAFIAFPLTIILVFTALPTVAGVALSFFEWGGGDRPRFIALDNYQAAMTHDPQFWLAMRNTLVFAIGTVPVTVVLAFLVAVALHARWFVGKTLARTLFFLPTVMSIVAVGFVWQWMLNPRTGLLNVIVAGQGPATPGTAETLMVNPWVASGAIPFNASTTTEFGPTCPAVGVQVITPVAASIVMPVGDVVSE